MTWVQCGTCHGEGMQIVQYDDRPYNPALTTTCPGCKGVGGWWQDDLVNILHRKYTDPCALGHE